MTLIKCNECGKEISDNEKECPYCGKTNYLTICLECKKEIAKKAKICPYCGAKNKNNNNKKKTIIILTVIFILLAILGLIFINYLSSKDTYYEPEDYETEEIDSIEGVYIADNGFTLMLLENGNCNLNNPDYSVDEDLSIYTSACNYSMIDNYVYINYTVTVTTMYGQTYNSSANMNGTYNGTSILIDGGANYIKQ